LVTPQLERTIEALRRHGLDAVLLATPPAVTYVSGWESPLPGGYVTEVTSWLPPLAYVTASGSGALIVSEDEAGDARARTTLDVRPFDSLRHFEPSDPAGTWASALRDAVRAAGATRVGVEGAVPKVAIDALVDAQPGMELADASLPLHEARMIKTAPEIERLRAAVAVADAAQRQLVSIAADAAQMTELLLWNQVTGAMQAAAGSAISITGVLITGPRTARLASTGPSERTVHAGDVALLDIGGRVDGYWSDCANSVVLGAKPTAEQRRYLDAARAACEEAIAQLHPGRSCSAPALALRERLEVVGLHMAHYAGHQLGTGVNEPPRLLPFATELIEEGMVFAVEAGAYAGEGGALGVRCEKVALVTADGPQLLSGFSWD
jgi:Xaa-Pro aminopeptidase